MKYLVNALSLNMVSGFPAQLSIGEIPLSRARTLAAECQSAVGHADTAAVFADVLGIPVEAKRTTVEFFPNDTLIVGQYLGPRLPEGAKTLPGDAIIKWFIVTRHH